VSWTRCESAIREFEHLLHRSGFTVEALQGSFDGGPVRPGGELIWRARAAP
jgi:hypothetical protein